jgi:hypothetical protein
VSISRKGFLEYRNYGAGTRVTSTRSVATGQWHELQVRVVISGDTSKTQVWLNGEEVLGLAQNGATLGTRGVRSIQIGDNYEARTFDVVYDDVKAGGAMIEP